MEETTGYSETTLLISQPTCSHIPEKRIFILCLARTLFHRSSTEPSSKKTYACTLHVSVLFWLRRCLASGYLPSKKDNETCIHKIYKPCKQWTLDYTGLQLHTTTRKCFLLSLHLHTLLAKCPCVQERYCTLLEVGKSQILKTLRPIHVELVYE